jgi:hypothetical protein
MNLPVHGTGQATRSTPVQQASALARCHSCPTVGLPIVNGALKIALYDFIKLTKRGESAGGAYGGPYYCIDTIVCNTDMRVKV